MILYQTVLHCAAFRCCHHSDCLLFQYYIALFVLYYVIYTMFVLYCYSCLYCIVLFMYYLQGDLQDPQRTFVQKATLVMKVSELVIFYILCGKLEFESGFLTL